MVGEGGDLHEAFRDADRGGRLVRERIEAWPAISAFSSEPAITGSS